MGMRTIEDHVSVQDVGATVPDAIRRTAQHARGGFTFMRSDGSQRYYSFPEIVEEMDRRGQRLLARGLRKGDRLAMVLPESDDFVLSFLGAMAVGVVPVPMYPPLSFGKLDSYVETSRRILEASQARMMVCSRKVQAVLWSLVDAVDVLEDIVTVEKLNAMTIDEALPVDVITPADTSFLQFTSGSTSTPKGVVVSHRSLMANLHGIMRHGLRIDPENDVAVSWLPLYHDMGLIGFMLAPVCYGVPTVYIPTLTFVKHPTIWLETMSKYRGTIAFAPNFAFALAVRRTRAKKLEQLDLSSVRVLGCGAEPNHPDTLRAFVDHFAPAGLRPQALLPCYGMAEATLAMSFCGLEETLRTDVIDAEIYHSEGRAVPLNISGTQDELVSRGAVSFVSCGRPFPGHELTIIDQEGMPLPDREVGEIVFHGPSVTEGYFRNPDASREAFRPEGLRTGDLGYMVKGELFVTGRVKDVIILNGRNYDPQSIEWIVADVANVRKGNVVAFSAPGASTERLVVVAEVKDLEAREEITAAIQQRVSETLFLRVDDVALVGPGALPKTSSGKLQRRRTREFYLEGRLGSEGVRTLGERGRGVILGKHVARSFVSRARHSLRSRARGLVDNLRRPRR